MTLFKDFLRDLWKTRTRFVSILLIVALGCGFFAGISATGDNMKLTMDTYLRETNFFDIMVSSNFGITKEDVEEISQISGVKRVSPSYQYDVLLETEEAKPAVRVSSYNVQDVEGDSNKFQLVTGRLPEKPGECLVEDVRNPMAHTLSDSFTLGKKIKIMSGKDDQDLYDFIKNSEYTVVGTVSSPLYFARTDVVGPTNIGSGTREGYVFLPETEFTMEAYAKAYVHLDETKDLSTFSKEYNEIITMIITDVEKTSDIRETIRFDEIKEEPQEKIDDAQEELAKGKADGEKEIEDGKKKLLDAEVELEEGKKDYLEGEATFNKEIADADKKLADAKIELEDAKTELEDGRKEFNDGYKAYSDGVNAMGPVEEEMKNAKAELDFAKSELDAARAQINSGYKEIETKQNELNIATAQINGIKQVSSGVESVLLGGTALNQGNIDEIKAGLDQIPSAGSLSLVVQTYYDKLQVNDPSAAVEGAILNGAIVGLNSEANAAQTQVDAGQQELSKAKATLDGADKELKTQEAAFSQGLKKYEEGEKELAAGMMRLDEAKKELEKAERLLKDGEEKYEDGIKEYEDGLLELEKSKIEGRQKLDDAKEEIKEAEVKLADAKVELEEAEEDFIVTIKDGQQKIDDGRQELENLSLAQWSIIGRQNYQAVFDYGENAGRIDAISRIFPAFFLAIASLVCLTSMTRMVEEKRTQIGTLKSLGYTSRAITTTFLMYAILASVVGGLLGLFGGLKAFPYFIFTAYTAVLYRLPPIMLPYRPALMIGTLLVAVTGVVVATLSASLSALKQEPARLLRPAAPKSGKRIGLERITFIWKRLKFSQKVTMRNIFRYKKRMTMSLVGIAGCTALMLAAFGVRDSVTEVANYQFDKVTHYDAMVIIDDEKTSAKDTASVRGFLDESEHIKSYFFVGTIGAEALSKKRPKLDDISLRMVREEDYEELNSYFVVANKDGVIDLPDTGIILSDKLASLHKKKVGDSITIKIDDVEKEIEIKGIMENYVGHFGIMNEGHFQRTFNQRVKKNEILLHYNNNENLDFESKFSEEVIEVENVITISPISAFHDILTDQMDSLNAIVLVLILSSGLLSFIVMYNLTNINITEREREIATLKVLGYYPNETSAYIFRENILLTILGTLIGLVGGVFLFAFLVTSAEVDEIVFVKVIKIFSYIFSFLLSILFSILVQIVMSKRLKQINMIESLKSVE